MNPQDEPEGGSMTEGCDVGKQDKAAKAAKAAELAEIKADIREAKRRKLKDDLVDQGYTEEDAAILAKETDMG